MSDRKRIKENRKAKAKFKQQEMDQAKADGIKERREAAVIRRKKELADRKRQQELHGYHSGYYGDLNQMALAAFCLSTGFR